MNFRFTGLKTIISVILGLIIGFILSFKKVNGVIDEQFKEFLLFIPERFILTGLLIIVIIYIIWSLAQKKKR